RRAAARPGVMSRAGEGPERSGAVGAAILEAFPARGRIGVLIRDDRSGTVVVDHHADDLFESASMIKLGVLAVLAAEIGEGGFDPDASIDVLEADRAPGDGILRLLALPARWPVRDLAVAMTVLSDN